MPTSVSALILFKTSNLASIYSIASFFLFSSQNSSFSLTVPKSIESVLLTFFSSIRASSVEPPPISILRAFF